MSFSQWLQSLPLDFWLTFVLAIVSFVMVLYEFYRRKERKVATFFLVLTTGVFGLLAWRFFAKAPQLQFGHVPSPKDRIEVSKGDAWINDWPGMSRDPDGAPAQKGDNASALVLSAEGIVFSPNKTVLHLAVTNLTGGVFANLQQAAGAYIIDDQGASHNLEAEGRPGGSPFFASGEVRPGVTERFELSFDPVHSTSVITLFHPQFPPITIYKFKPPPATVVFCRPFKASAVFNGWYGMDVSCDRQGVISGLGVGKSASVTFDFGRHSCKARYETAIKSDGDALDFTVAPGKGYYIRAEFDPVWGKANLTPVPTQAECMHID